MTEDITAVVRMMDSEVYKQVTPVMLLRAVMDLNVINGVFRHLLKMIAT